MSDDILDSTDPNPNIEEASPRGFTREVFDEAADFWLRRFQGLVSTPVLQANFPALYDLIVEKMG